MRSLRRMSVILGVVLLAWPGWPASFVESEGKATVEAIPNYVEFWFHVVRDGATIKEASEQVANLEERVRTVVKERELTPTEIEVSSLAIPDVRISEVQRSVRLRFSALNFTDPEKGAARFAAFCDQLVDLGAKEEWIIEGPNFGVSNRDEFEQLAVANATKNAFPVAEGVSQVMRGNLTSVDSVQVLSLEWNRPPEERFTRPDLRTLACSAHVRVTYLFEPATAASR